MFSNQITSLLGQKNIPAIYISEIDSNSNFKEQFLNNKQTNFTFFASVMFCAVPKDRRTKLNIQRPFNRNKSMQSLLD